MTLFRSLIRATSLSGFLKHGAGLADGDSVETTNRYVATTHSRSSMFASLFFGVQNPAGGQFTEQGILDAAAAGQADAEGCLRQVLKGVHAFRGAAPQSDDITMLAVRKRRSWTNHWRSGNWAAWACT